MKLVKKIASLLLISAVLVGGCVVEANSVVGSAPGSGEPDWSQLQTSNKKEKVGL